MDGTGSGMTNRVRIGSHTASDARVARLSHASTTLFGESPEPARQVHRKLTVPRLRVGGSSDMNAAYGLWRTVNC